MHNPRRPTQKAAWILNTESSIDFQIETPTTAFSIPRWKDLLKRIILAIRGYVLANRVAHVCFNVYMLTFLIVLSPHYPQFLLFPFSFFQCSKNFPFLLLIFALFFISFKKILPYNISASTIPFVRKYIVIGTLFLLYFCFDSLLLLFLLLHLCILFWTRTEVKYLKGVMWLLCS